jgi:hypothetical protein
VDGCRVEGKLEGDPNRFAKTDGGSFNKFTYAEPIVRSEGRFPANFIHDGSDEVLALMPDSAARFFYCAKASKADRDAGCEGGRNLHPTVKPTALMRYLCRMITPPAGIVLDPFMGSGSTGKAAKMEGFDFIGIELNPDYVTLAQRRIDAAVCQPDLFS